VMSSIMAASSAGTTNLKDQGNRVWSRDVHIVPQGIRQIL